MLANMAPCAKYRLGNPWFRLAGTLGLSQQTSISKTWFYDCAFNNN